MLQPLDVALNKPFKSKLKDSWKNWIDQPTESHSLTPSGKRQRVSGIISIEVHWFLETIDKLRILKICRQVILR